jgi:hypothetical protein
MAVVCDNASNNDTLLEALEEKCTAEGIDFSHKNSRIRCLPHIVHLAATQVCSLVDNQMLFLFGSVAS